MTLRSRLLAAVCCAVALALAPVQAGENELYVRVVQVKATGSRADDAKATVEKSLEPLRAHLEQASKHAHYGLLGKSTTKKNAPGKAITFDLENKLRAEATPSTLGDKKLKLELKVTKRGASKDELVFETTLEMKDGATAVPVLEKAIEGADLLLAITASRDPL